MVAKKKSRPKAKAKSKSKSKAKAQVYQTRFKFRKPKAGKKFDYSPLGYRLRQLGTQAELSKVLKISQQTISKKMRGETNIMIADLELLSKKFKKPLPWFFMSAETEENLGAVILDSSYAVELRKALLG